MALKRIRGIVQHNMPPVDNNVLWLDTSQGSPILMAPYGTSWAPVLAASSTAGGYKEATSLNEIDSADIGIFLDLTTWYNSYTIDYGPNYQWSVVDITTNAPSDRYTSVVGIKTSSDALECYSDKGDVFTLQIGYLDDLNLSQRYGDSGNTEGFDNIVCTCVSFTSARGSHFNFDPYKYKVKTERKTYSFERPTYKKSEYNIGDLSSIENTLSGIHNAVNSNIIIDCNSYFGGVGAVINSTIINSSFGGSCSEATISHSICCANVVCSTIDHCVLLLTRKAFVGSSSSNLQPYEGYAATLTIEHSDLGGLFGIIPIVVILSATELEGTPLDFLSNLTLHFNCSDADSLYVYKATADTTVGNYTYSTAPRLWYSTAGEFSEEPLALVDLNEFLIDDLPQQETGDYITPIMSVGTPRHFLQLIASSLEDMGKPNLGGESQISISFSWKQGGVILVQ